MGSDEPSLEATFDPLHRPTLPDLRELAIIGLPVFGILLSEGFLYVDFLGYALWGHVVTLVFCVVAPLKFSDRLPVLQALGLVPLFRLVNLGMPVFFQLTIYWFPLIYGPLIPALVLIQRSNAPVTPTYNWRKLLLFSPLALGLAILLAEIEYRILQPEALIPVWSWPQLLFISIIMIGFVGFVEELLFRGILQRTLEARLGMWPGLVLASGIFGLMHSGYGRPTEILFAGLIGLLLGVIYDRTESIAIISLIHGVLNVFLFAVIPMWGSILTKLP